SGNDSIIASFSSNVSMLPPCGMFFKSIPYYITYIEKVNFPVTCIYLTCVCLKTIFQEKTAYNIINQIIRNLCSSRKNMLYYNQTTHLSYLHQKLPKGRAILSMPLLIKEESPTSIYTKHDQLFKELINTFFEEFLEAFFPDVHNNID